MKTRGKRYQEMAKKIEPKKSYEIDEAVTALKSLEPRKFDQTVELAIRLGIDPKRSDQIVRGSVSLPKGIGKSRRVIVFASGDEAKIAQEAGADEVGAEELIKKISGGWQDFDVAITVPNMMRVVGKLGKILGPQGKMPSPKAGTVTQDIATAVKEFKAGKIEFRNDASGNLHAPVGKLSFKPEDLKQNIEYFVEYIKSARPSSVKGAFIHNMTLSASMAPGLRLKVR